MADRTPHVCALYHEAIELIGRRWTGAILNALLGGPVRFAHLAEAIPGITDRMLSERLKELEQEGLVIRRVTPDTPVRVDYELTRKGRALEEALGAVATWATEWLAPPKGARRRSA